MDSRNILGDTMDLQIGDLVFVKGESWIDKIIKWVTKSKYSHVAIYVGNGQVFEAQVFRKAGYRALSYYEGIYDFKLIPNGTKEGLFWLYQQEGRPYSYWSDFVILVKRLFNVNIPWREGISVMCSRLGRDYVFHCGYPIPDIDMSPEDLDEWVNVNIS